MGKTPEPGPTSRSFARTHVFAWITAVIFAVPSAMALTLVPPNFVLHNPLMSLVPVLVISSVGLILAWALAKFLGEYDVLLVLAGVLAVALSFAISYSMDIDTFLPDDGHTFFDVVTFGARPFDVFGQGTILAGLTLWCGGIIAAAIALKRSWKKHAPQGAATVDKPRLLRWLAIDVLVIVCATSVGLGVKMQDRIAQGKPDFLIHQLQASTTSVPDRLHDIYELSNFRTSDTTAALRDAAIHQAPPLNLTAALALLEQNDISELPLVEDSVLRNPAILQTAWTPSQLETYIGDIQDPAAIPALTRMMGSPRADVRRGVARALSHIRDPDVIDPLVQGLDDSDQEVRYHSVCGLITIAGDGHYPAESKFLENEDAYLKFWRDWAKARVTARI